VAAGLQTRPFGLAWLRLLASDFRLLASWRCDVHGTVAGAIATAAVKQYFKQPQQRA
jgi:hypothetical protein